MAEVTLEVSGRDGTGKSAVRKLRQQGKVPGVVYGVRYRLICLAALVVTMVDRRGPSPFWLRWPRESRPNRPYTVP